MVLSYELFLKFGNLVIITLCKIVWGEMWVYVKVRCKGRRVYLGMKAREMLVAGGGPGCDGWIMLF